MAYAFVQEVEASSNASAGSIASPNITTTAGNVLHVAALADPDTTCTFGDVLGGSYTPIGDIREALIAIRTYHAYANGINGGLNTVTATYGTGTMNKRAVYVLEISGLSPTAPLNAHNEVTDAGTNPTATATCTNTSQPGVLFSIGTDLQGHEYSTGTGMTTRTAQIWGSAYFTAVQYKNISTNAGQTSNFVNGFSDRGVQLAALYIEPSISITTIPGYGLSQPGRQAVGGWL
jgi:hypothetical protein